MGLYNNIPVFLTTDSGYSKDECEQINIIVRTARKRFETKSKQEQLEKPKIEKFISSKYARVLNLLDYKYGKDFSISFILNPNNFANNIEYPLFEFDDNISFFQFQGSHDETIVAKTLSSLGRIEISDKFDKPTFVFIPTDVEHWPRNTSNRLVAYSVFIGGKLV